MKVYVVGEKVKCRYKGGSSYACTLESYTNRTDEKWTVKWDDGDSQDRTGHPPSDFTEEISEAVT